eukprot:ctg_1224.g423
MQRRSRGCALQYRSGVQRVRAHTMMREGGAAWRASERADAQSILAASDSSRIAHRDISCPFPSPGPHTVPLEMLAASDSSRIAHRDISCPFPSPGPHTVRPTRPRTDRSTRNVGVSQSSPQASAQTLPAGRSPSSIHLRSSRRSALSLAVGASTRGAGLAVVALAAGPPDVVLFRVFRGLVQHLARREGQRHTGDVLSAE